MLQLLINPRKKDYPLKQTANSLKFPWLKLIRPCGDKRRPVSPMTLGIVVFRCPMSESVTPVEEAIQCPARFCCNEFSSSMPESNHGIGMETLCEDTDWVDLEDQKPLSQSVQKQLRKSIMSLRKASSRLTLSRIATDPAVVGESRIARLVERPSPKA